MIAHLRLVWRRTWDSNPRGCYTLLDFQSSSLATRSILQVCAAQRHLYYYSISGPALQAKFRQSCIFSFRKATFFFHSFLSFAFSGFSQRFYTVRANYPLSKANGLPALILFRQNASARKISSPCLYPEPAHLLASSKYDRSQTDRLPHR